MKIDSTAGRELLGNAANLPIWVKDRLLSLHLASEITKSALERRTSWSGVDTSCGRAALVFQRHQQALFGDGIASQRSLAPFFDLFYYGRGRTHMDLNLLFVLQMLRTMRPLVVDVGSARNNHLLRAGIIEHLLEKGLSSIALLDSPSFTLEQATSSIRQTISNLKYVGWERPFILIVGYHYLARFGDQQHDFSLAIAQLHPGFISYDPAIKTLALRLYDLVALKSQAVKLLVAKLVRQSGPPSESDGAEWWSLFLARIDGDVVLLELNEQISATRKRLYDVKTALDGQRGIASYTRRRESGGSSKSGNGKGESAEPSVPTSRASSKASSSKTNVPSPKTNVPGASKQTPTVKATPASRPTTDHRDESDDEDEIQVAQSHKDNSNQPPKGMTVERTTSPQAAKRGASPQTVDESKEGTDSPVVDLADYDDHAGTVFAAASIKMVPKEAT